jgi:beta-mannosidase
MSFAVAIVLAAAGGNVQAVPPLRHGISIDRQLSVMPPDDRTTVHRDDIRRIKAMGFDHVKMIFNPDVIKKGIGLDPAGIAYLDAIVQFAVDERLPAVICIHPSARFKKQTLNDPHVFAEFVRFVETLSEHIAAKWSPDHVVFQLMTEPFATSNDRNAWNHWDKLQHRLWAAVRAKMPRHLLILSGDKVGSIDGLFDITPVEDDNVLYGFSYYDPQVFTQQGVGPENRDLFFLKDLPYPSGSETLAAMPAILATVPDRWKAAIAQRIRLYAAEQWDDAKLAATIGRLAEWRNLHGGKLRLWCAEFGCYEAAPRKDRLCYLQQVRRLLEQQCVGWCYWSYNEWFTVMTADRIRNGPADRQTPDRELLNALMPNSISLAGSDWRIVADYEAKGVEKKWFDAAITSPGWIPSHVPGNIQADVEAAHIVGPFWYGGVDTKVSDIARRDWWYRKDFTLPRNFEGKRLTLTFDGVDDRCKVWLNGKLLGGAAGMFNRFSFDVTDCALSGQTNHLAVWIARMPEELVPMLLGSDGPNNGPIYGLADRARHLLKNFKTPGSMGFDWSVNLWTLGIWRDVRVEATGPAKILWTRVESKVDRENTHATIHASLDVDSAVDGQWSAMFRLSGHGANILQTVPALLRKGRNTILAELPLNRPALWWPNGQGDQPLYTLDASIQPADGSVASDASTTQFGVREIRWAETENATPSSGKDVLTFTGRELIWQPAKDAKPDHTSRLQLIVNGRPVRMIGTAMILPRIFPGCDTEYTLHLLRCARAAGMNALRLNGGGGGPLFDESWYALADRLGIMISYEYPVANTMLDPDPETLHNMDVACRDMIRRTRNHPSIIEYVGGSEMGPIGKDFDTLDYAPFMLLMRRIAVEESDRIFRVTCPELGTKHGPWDFLLLPPKQSTQDAAQPPAGTMPDQPHLTKTGYQYYDGPDGETMRYGEFGTASPANVEVWHRFIPPTSRWPLDRVDDPVLIYHNATKACFTDANWLFKPWIDRAFGPLDNLGEFVAAGQFYGAEGLRYIYDALRRKGRRIGGMTSHCFSEPWPNAAGSYMIDCDGRPLMNFDFVKQAMAPVSLSLKMNSPLYDPAKGADAELFLTSDAQAAKDNLTVRWLIRDCQGTVLNEGSARTSVAPLEVKSLGAVAIRPRKETCRGPILVELQIEDAARQRLTERVHVFGSSAATYPFRGLLKCRDAAGGMAACLPVRQTTLEARILPSPATNDEDVLALEVKNTGAMTALFCRPRPMLVDRGDLVVDNNHCFVPPGQSRIITIRAPAPSKSGLSLRQTGWTLSTWNADDAVIAPNEDVVLSCGRWDQMCREFKGCDNAKMSDTSVVVEGVRPDAGVIPYRLTNVGEAAFTFDIRPDEIGGEARLRIHTSDQSLTPAVLQATINGRTLETPLPKGLGIQRWQPAHLAFPATTVFKLRSSDLHVGKNTLVVRVVGDGWFSWDALDLLVNPKTEE